MMLFPVDHLASSSLNKFALVTTKMEEVQELTTFWRERKANKDSDVTIVWLQHIFVEFFLIIYMTLNKKYYYNDMKKQTKQQGTYLFIKF